VNRFEWPAAIICTAGFGICAMTFVATGSLISFAGAIFFPYSYPLWTEDAAP
jgi:hypothetical protein